MTLTLDWFHVLDFLLVFFMKFFNSLWLASSICYYLHFFIFYLLHLLKILWWTPIFNGFSTEHTYQRLTIFLWLFLHNFFITFNKIRLFLDQVVLVHGEISSANFIKKLDPFVGGLIMFAFNEFSEKSTLEKLTKESLSLIVSLELLHIIVFL